MRLMRKNGVLKKYSYDEGSKTPRDITGFTLGNGRGKIMAAENAMGLPIISWLSAPITGRMQVVTGYNTFYTDYKNNVFFHPKYAPAEHFFFEDGMQPVVTVLPTDKSEEQKIYWCMDMKAESRRFINNTAVAETVTTGEGFRLTTTDFAGWDRDVIYRVFKLENTDKIDRAYRLTHYLPLNPFGNRVRCNVPEWRENWRKQSPYNRVQWNSENSALFFSTECPEDYDGSQRGYSDAASNWVVISNLKADEYDCGIKPDVMDRTDEGISGYGNAQGIVDAQMTFNTGVLKPGAFFEAAFAIIPTESGTDELKKLREEVLPFDSDCGELIEKGVSSWEEWLNSGNIPEDSDPQIQGFVRRMLCSMKKCIREDGLMAADGVIYPEYFTRDVLKPARAFAAFGFQKEARGILMSLAAEISIRGIVNCSGSILDLQKAIDNGFIKESIPKTEKCTPDCPQEFLLAIADYFSHYPEDMETIKKLYPIIQYLADLCEQYTNADGMVMSDDAINDDFLQWSFWRSSEREFKNGRPGLVCCYFNMEWVSSLEKMAKIARLFGEAQDADKWLKWAKRIREGIETKFWNEDLKQYAYFYDPNPIDRYGTSGANNPQTAYIGVVDENKGMYVFPDPPLMHGQTVPFLADYSDDERAHMAYRVTKEQTGEIRDIFSLLKERADRASIYYQYVQAQVLAGDEDAEKGIEWILRETPLPGPPERFPSNRSSVLNWCTADALLAMYYYLQSKK